MTEYERSQCRTMVVLRSISWLCQQHTLLISHVLATHKLCVVKYQHNTPQQSIRNHNPQPCCFDGALLQPLFPSCHCCCEHTSVAVVQDGCSGATTQIGPCRRRMERSPRASTMAVVGDIDPHASRSSTVATNATAYRSYVAPSPLIRRWLRLLLCCHILLCPSWCGWLSRSRLMSAGASHRAAASHPPLVALPPPSLMVPLHPTLAAILSFWLVVVLPLITPCSSVPTPHIHSLMPLTPHTCTSVYSSPVDQRM